MITAAGSATVPAMRAKCGEWKGLVIVMFIKALDKIYSKLEFFLMCYTG